MFKLSKCFFYNISFQHGGAHGQFAGIPMNIAYETGKVDFVNCGAWSQKAMGEASKYADVHVCATFDKAVIHPSEWKYRPDSSYIHICLNETMTGIEFLFDPELPEGAPVLVGDATSTLFSRPVDISKYGMIYASAGKNFGRNYGYNSSVIYVFVFLSLSGIYIYIYKHQMFIPVH